VAAALYIIYILLYIRTVLSLLFFIYLFISSSPNRYVSTLTTEGRGLCRPNIDDKAANPPLLLILRPSWRDTAYQWYAKWCILDRIVYLKLARVLTKSHYSSRQLSVNIICQLCTDYILYASAGSFKISAANNIIGCGLRITMAMMYLAVYTHTIQPRIPCL